MDKKDSGAGSLSVLFFPADNLPAGRQAQMYPQINADFSAKSAFYSANISGKGF